MPKVLGSRETTPQLRKSICQQAAQGHPLSQIAINFHLPVRTVQSIVKRGAERGYNENEPRIGRPRKIDHRSLRHLKLNILRDRRQSLQNITSDANLFLPSPMHPTTVQRALKTGLGVSCHIAAKKPFLSTVHIRKRKEWVKEVLLMTREDWIRIIWTDECSVEVGKQSRECVVWRKPGERYELDCLVLTFKSGRQSVMVWGCISYGMQGPLVQIPSGMRTGADYVHLILNGPLWEFYIQQSEEKGFVKVVEDGAPTHCSKAAQTFQSQNSLEMFPHPPQSPDMNPIEHVWKQLKVLVNKCPIRPQNINLLWVALQEEWLKIDNDFINSLIDSMPHRVQALHSAQGRSTKY
jgi:transposase